MVTKLKRYTVNLNMDLETFIEKEAQFNKRPVANQIVYILDQFRVQKLNELEFYRPSPLHAAKAGDEPQYFQTPSVQPEERLSKLREKLGRDQT
jgi:hypothetical protein